jgi:alanyl-tRNA synthetase
MQRRDGTREPLARPGIDTGMGFERLASVLQGAASIHETDNGLPVLAAVRDEAEAASGKRPPEGKPSTELVVIADHSRAATFAIAEGILPSNEAQGYVIRRLIRRAVRRGIKLGIDAPFLYRVSGVVIDVLGDAHPHLVQKREHIALVVKSEEERFHETLASGSAVFEEMIESLSGGDATVVPGEVAFSLYDTYGFPLDLTQEMAAERGFTVDTDGFRAAMEDQKERGRKASAFGGAGAGEWEGSRVETEFTGYELPCSCGDGTRCESEDSVLSGPVATTVGEVRRAGNGDVEFTLSVTPFYAESGGQVADTGTLTIGDTTIEVVNVLHRDDRLAHMAADPEGAVTPGAEAMARVDVARRRLIEKNHTATHLLQAALRGALGDHVHQSGSWVGPDRLRFDFTHFSELSADQIVDIEDRVNAWVRSNVAVAPRSMELDEALSQGAMALFGEKYDSADVRVISIGCDESRVSMELCGGTHVERTGEIGAFTIVGESSVAAGVRRIEAVTGRTAVERARLNGELVRELAGVLKAAPAEALEKARELAAETSKLRKEIEKERQKSAGGSVDSLLDGAREVAGVRLLSARTDAPDIKTLRGSADRLRDRLGSGAGILAAVTESGVMLIAVVTEDLVKNGKLKAGDLVREVSAVMGGRGGGKPHLAQGGGGDPEKLPEALESFYEIAGRALEE